MFDGSFRDLVGVGAGLFGKIDVQSVRVGAVIGPARGCARCSATDIGGFAVREALRRFGAPADAVDEVNMGNVLQMGEGQAPARQAVLKGGVPDTVPALKVNIARWLLGSEEALCGEMRPT